MKKIIFTDIDGTVLSHTTDSVPASTLEAMHTLRANGTLIYGCTGRNVKELKQLPLDDLELDGWITMNGSYCFNAEQIIYDAPLKKEDLSLLLEYLKIHPFPVQFLEADRMYMNAYSDAVREGLAAIHTALDPIGDPNDCLRNPTYMIIPWTSEEIWAPLYAQFTDIVGVRWNDYAVDCFSKQSGKDKGILAVLDHLHIDAEDACAIGDAENDLAMFDVCAHSIAMGNACEEVRAKADQVTDHIDEDGWAHAFL